MRTPRDRSRERWGVWLRYRSSSRWAQNARADSPAAVIFFAGGLHRLYPQSLQFDYTHFFQTEFCVLLRISWHTAATKPSFLRRNRLIAGTTHLTVLVEAMDRSGALVTARRALEEGREVVVAKHPDNHYEVAGNRELIEGGALAFSSADELLQY